MRIILNFQSILLQTTQAIYFDVLFLISVYSGLKCCLSLLGTPGIRVLPRNFSSSVLFTATYKNSLCAGCVSAVSHFVEIRRYLQETEYFFVSLCLLCNWKFCCQACTLINTQWIELHWIEFNWTECNWILCFTLCSHGLLWTLNSQAFK